MIFHGYFRSSSAHRCRIAFNLKGLDPELKYVHLRRDGGQQNSSSYLARNPQGLVPTLETERGVLTQSLAIIEWLDESYPAPLLLPGNATERALVRGCAQVIACDIHPLQNLRVLDYLRAELEAEQAALDAWCQRWIIDGLSACEKLVRPSRRYCFGDTPTLADVCLVPQFFSARRFGVDTERFPNLRTIFDNCMELKAFADASPDQQADAE